MAEKSYFFNSAPGDPRTYQASDFAQYFGNVLSSGLIHTNNTPALEVRCDGNDLRTYVTPGKAIIQGYAYENTENLYLEHALPEPTLDRIDRIVLRLDKRHQSRYIRLFVKQGTPSADPVPPDLQRDDFIYELSLARIRVRANTSTLNPADLIDERLDENLCGLVHSLISIPTSQFEREWREFMDSVKDEGFATQADLNTLQQQFNAHLADNAAHGVGDRSALLTTAKDTLVNAINELFTFANDGKTQIANAITAKGVPADPTETFSSLAMKIGQISTGKKWASGSITSSSTMMPFVYHDGFDESRYYIEVSSLAFTPGTVVVYKNYGLSFTVVSIEAPKYQGFTLVFVSVSDTGYLRYRLTGNAYLNSTGFRLPVDAASNNYFWLAFE